MVVGQGDEVDPGTREDPRELRFATEAQALGVMSPVVGRGLLVVDHGQLGPLEELAHRTLVPGERVARDDVVVEDRVAAAMPGDLGGAPVEGVVNALALADDAFVHAAVGERVATRDQHPRL